MKVVIIGAGILGLGTAQALAEIDGIEATVLEARYAGGGSTGLSVGAYVRQYLDPDEIALRCAGVERLERLERDGGLTLRRIGVLRIIRDAQTWDQAVRAVELQHHYGVVDSRVIDAEELSERLPQLNTAGMLGALWGPSDGYLDGTELCSTLVEAVQAKGVAVHVRTKVTGLSRGSMAKYVVHASRAEFPADVVVNASGPWLEKVGACLDTPVWMLNERHEAYIFLLPKSVSYTFPETLDYLPFVDQEPGLYFRQEGADQLIAGLHSNEISGAELVDPDDYYKGVTYERAEAVIRRLVEALPGLDDLAYQGGWAGLYPHSSAGRPILGPHADNEDVIVAGGLAGQGLTVGLAIGEAAAEWVRFGELREWSSLERLRLPETITDAVGDSA